MFVMNNDCKDCNVVDGIKCSVESCVYHSEKDNCHAGHITVGGDSHACECSETSCRTFKAKA